MLKIKTLIGSKVASIKECLKLKSIIEEISVHDEMFWEHPDAELILDEFPDLKIPVLPKSRKRAINLQSCKSLHKDGCDFKIGVHTMDRYWLKELGISCPYCGGADNHSHCSPEGVCEYTERAIKAAISSHVDVVFLSSIFNHTKLTDTWTARKLIRPYRELGIGTGTETGKYRDAFRAFIVNGVTVYSKYKIETFDGISENMVFPWNSPLVTHHEKNLWCQIFHEREIYRSNPSKYKPFMEYTKQCKALGKIQLFFKLTKTLQKFIEIEEIPEHQLESLKKFIEKNKNLEIKTHKECRDEHYNIYFKTLYNSPIIND